MASILDSLVEGIRFTEDPLTGQMTYVEAVHVCDLDPGTPGTLIAQALSLVPARGTAGPIAGTVLVQRNPTPWPPLDCTVELVYQSPGPGDIIDGPPRISIRTSLSQSETDFTAEDLAKPFAQRKPITVSYDSSTTGAPGPSAQKQSVRVPILLPRSVVVFNRRTSTNPAARSRQYVGKLNADSFLGHEPETFLCVEVAADSFNGSTWGEVLSFEFDPIEKFKQVARWVNPSTGIAPELTPNHLANENGIRQIAVQGKVAFAPLNLAA